MTSLKDLAAASGFSVRTVSRVLKQEPGVRKEVRKKILLVSKQFGYRPNILARGLRTGVSRIIAVHMPNVDELFVAKVAGLEKIFQQHGYMLNLIFGNFYSRFKQADMARELAEQLLQVSPDAVALFNLNSAILKPLVAYLQLRSVPYVVMDAKKNEFDGIIIDRQKGVYEAVRYLYEEGRQHIAYLGSRADSNRVQGYFRALREWGMDEIIIELDRSNSSEPFGQGRKAAKVFLKKRIKPDAVQAYSDEVALGFLAGLHEQGVKVPDDVAVVGFDGRRAASLSWPRLTTVAQPNEEVGVAAAEILLQKIEKQKAPGDGWSETLPTRLLIREST